MSELELLARFQPSVDLQKVLSFVIYASQLRNDIILAQPGSYNPNNRPARPFLPPTIEEFIATVVAIPRELVPSLWEALSDLCMHSNLHQEVNDVSQGKVFEAHGHSRGISECLLLYNYLFASFVSNFPSAYQTLYPRSHFCENRSCDRAGRLALKKAETRQCVLFTMSGAKPIWSIHLYCERRSKCSASVNQVFMPETIGCKINYHHNFSVCANTRTYHQDVPKILQIGEHQFAEVKVINMWISMMLLSWTSATNCARIYNMAFSVDTSPTWQFSLSATSDQVYDAFTILSLIEDCVIRNECLVVPHDGSLKDRFLALVRARNNRFRLTSQPELFHYCTKCTRFYGELKGMWPFSD